MKGNQKNLLKHCEEIAGRAKTVDQHRAFDKGHGRTEKRLTEVFSYRPIGNVHWDELIKTVVKVTRKSSRFHTKEKTWIPSHEESFYVCTKKLKASLCAQAIRSHWSIENSNHHVRDVSLGEDASRIRKNPDLFCILRSFALNLMRFNGSTNIRSDRYRNALSLRHLLSYVAIC